MQLEEALVRAPAFLLGIGLHEWAHAFVADRAGDPTPRSQGRVTLNPLAHLDPMGTLCILFAPIGWGKPVMVSPSHFRDPARDHMRVAAAGPLMNVWIACTALLAIELLQACLGAGWLAPGGGVRFLGRALGAAVVLNMMLAIFNLLPIPPLDGERVAMYHFGAAGQRWMATLRPYGMLIILALVMSRSLDGLFGLGFSTLAVARGLGTWAVAALAVLSGLLWGANAGVVPGLSPAVDRAYGGLARRSRMGELGPLPRWGSDETYWERLRGRRRP